MHADLIGKRRLTVSRPFTVSPRSAKNAIVASRSRTAIPTFSSLMDMRPTLPRSGETSPELRGIDSDGIVRGS